MVAGAELALLEQSGLLRDHQDEHADVGRALVERPLQAGAFAGEGSARLAEECRGMNARAAPRGLKAEGCRDKSEALVALGQVDACQLPVVLLGEHLGEEYRDKSVVPRG